MVGWAKNIGIPRKNEDGTWELINQTAHEKAVEDAKTAIHHAGMMKAQAGKLSTSELFQHLQQIQQLS